MTAETVTNEELSSSIAHHGAYIWETKRLLETYIEHESYDAVKKAVLENNLLRKSSESYRKNILQEISRRYDLDREGYTETPLVRAFKRPLTESLQEWILYYEFSREPIVTLLTTEFLYPEFHTGALTLQKEDVVEFLNQPGGEFPVIDSWSENTRLRVAEHYLAAMKNFDMLKGSKQKEFKYVYPPDELIVYVLYSLFEQDVTTADAVVEHPDWKLLLLTPEEVRDRLQDVSPTYVTYEKRGSVERLEPIYQSLRRCVDEF
jgi:hypothetical protein